MIPWLDGFFNQLLGSVDTTRSVNLAVLGGVFALAMLSEIYIQVPLLMETIWLAVGYQSTVNATAVLNLVILFLAASAGRQVTMNILYAASGAINNPVSSFFGSRMQKNKYYRKYTENQELYNLKFFTPASASLGMLTWLNGPIKFALIAKRKRRVLLIATLLSGMTFDIIYIVMGAVFHEMPFPIAYMPLLFLVGFIFFFVLKRRVAR